MPLFFTRRRFQHRPPSQEVKDIEFDRDDIVSVFQRIKNIFDRVEPCATVRPTDAMIDIIMKMMIVVLELFAVLTREMKDGRARELFTMIYFRQLNLSLLRKISVEVDLWGDVRVYDGVETVGGRGCSAGGCREPGPETHAHYRQQDDYSSVTDGTPSTSSFLKTKSTYSGTCPKVKCRLV